MSTPPAPESAPPIVTPGAGALTGPPPPGPPYAAPASPPRRSPMVWAAVGVVVVVIVIVLALVLSGALSPSGGSSSSPRSFSSSRGAAQSTADGSSGGPWTLLLALGFATSSTYSGNVSNLTSVAGSVSGTQCTFSPSPGAPTSLQSGGVGNVSQGVAGTWLYLYTNSTGAVLLVGTIGGSTSAIGTLTGAGCNLASSGLLPIPSTGIVDSTTAASAAASAGGSTFLAAHPQANATFILTGGITIGGTTIGPSWLVEYLACSLSGSGPATAPLFEAVISATSGGLLEAQTTTATCPSSSGGQPLGSALSVAPPSESSKGANTWYNFSVQSAAGGLTLGDLRLQVQTPSGTPVTATGAWTFDVLGLTGTVLASYSMTANAWTMGATTAVSSQETFCLDAVGSYSTLSGDVLVISGTGSFQGTVSVAIP
jgi:hypothetical protein